PCTPVISASAMMTAITPTPTPRTETAEIREMKACRRRAVRYRRATNHANAPGGCAIALPIVPDGASVARRGGIHRTRPHQRKQDDIANRRAVGEEHHQPIDANPFPAGRRQSVLERPDVILIHLMRLGIA